MPDLSDKVSGRPDDIPEDVLTEAMRVARYVVAFRENLAAAARPIARAIMADRRTRPPASSMEGAERDALASKPTKGVTK